MRTERLAQARRRQSARWLAATPAHAVVLLVAGAWLTPTLALLVSSFRPADRIANTGWWAARPSELTLENYRQVLAANGLGESFVNSLLVTVPATVLVVAVGSVAAYALAQMRFPAREPLFLALLVVSVVPIQMTLGPVLRLVTALGLTGTFPAVWLAHLGYGLPFAVYLLRNFFGALPRELFESAELDGASPLTVFLRLVLPVSLPALASLATFQFLWVWNDLLVALIFLGGRPSVAPITVAISNLVGQYGDGWQLLTAAAFVSMALPLLVFFALQRYFVRGLLAGAVKG